MLEYCDSFGIYQNRIGLTNCVPSQYSLMTRWNSIGNGNLQIATVGGAGARGNPALWLPFGAKISKTFSHHATYTVGARINISSTLGVGGGVLFELGNCAQLLVDLIVNADGSVTVRGQPSGAAVTILTTAVGIVASTNCYLELSVVLTGTTNINAAVQVWINGVSFGSANANIGINAAQLSSLSATFNRIYLSSGVVTNGGTYLSDFYVTNGDGATNTGALGPVEVDAYPLPNGDGGTLQWSAYGGGAHFSEINELPSDGDAGYVSSSVIGQVDSYDWQDVVTFSGTVKSVQLSYCARTNDEGSRAFRGNIGAGGVEQHTATYGLPFTYQYFHQAFDLDPATGLAWTRTNFNAKQFGIELVA